MKISIGGIKKDGLKALLSRINKKTAAIIGGAFAAAVAAAVIISVIAAGPETNARQKNMSSRFISRSIPQRRKIQFGTTSK